MRYAVVRLPDGREVTVEVLATWVSTLGIRFRGQFAMVVVEFGQRDIVKWVGTVPS